MFKLRLNPFFTPNDSVTPAIEDKEMSKEDMINFMKDDEDDDKPLKLDDKKDKEEKEDEKSDKKKDEEEKDKEEETDKEDEKEDEDEDLEDLEEELEEPDEEKLELMTPVKRKEILAKYPNVFKDFPYLERAYYREQQFTELLPTIDDAKTAVEKSNVLDAFETDLIKGDTEKILAGLKKESPDSFNKLVDNYLPTLAKVDTDAYHHVLGNVIKDTIALMVQESKRSDTEALKEAALILNQFVFGTSEYVPPSKLDKGEKKDEKEEQISERERAFVQRQYDNAKETLNTRVDNQIKATIELNIDPKKSMTDYVRRTAIRDAHEALNSVMDKDSRFRVIIDRLWENAFKSDFSTESVNRIKSAYLSRAKTLLPEVIKKARNEALKGLGKRVSDSEDETPKRNKGSLAPGRSASSNNSGKSAREQAKSIPAGMKSIDYLMQD